MADDAPAAQLAPVPCHGCRAVLGHTDGKRLRLGAADIVGGLLVCSRCGRVRKWQPPQVKVAAGDERGRG